VPIRVFFSRYGWLGAIAIAYLYVFPYFPAINSANELPRVYLVKAIVEDHTFQVDKGVARWHVTADVSPSAGHLYSNKAPGSSFLAAPPYALVRAVAGEPSLAATFWICRVFTGVIPMLLFLVLAYRFLERFAPEPEVRVLALVTYALGSLAMTYSILYYSHQLAAICIASAWMLAVDVVDRKRGLRAMAAAGFLAGAAPLVDYQAAFAGVPLVIYIVARMWRWPRRQLAQHLGVAAAAAAVPIAILLWYHAVCFGGPFRTGYDKSETFAHFHKQGFLGLTRPHWDAFSGSLWAANNGLLVLSPWVLLAIPGGVWLWRRGDRATVLACSGVALVFVLFVSSITFWRGGWGVGPRYITAMLPFLLPLFVVALAELRRWPWVAGVCAATIVSAVAIYVLSAATFPYWPENLRNPLVEVMARLLGDDAVAPSLGSAVGVSGIASLLPYLAITAAAVALALWRVFGARALALACLVAIAIVGAFWLVPLTSDARYREHAYRDVVYPAVVR
jgi:hypothetical protein